MKKRLSIDEMNQLVERRRQAMRARREAWQKQAASDQDMDIYWALVFETSKQRDAFVEAIADKLGIELHYRVADGLEVAKALGIGLPSSGWRPLAKQENRK